MSFHDPDAGALFEAHGSSFRSFVAPARGSAGLCAWRLDVPAGTAGVAHRVTREEVLLGLGGELLVTLDGAVSRLTPGSVLHVPAGGELRVDAPQIAGAAWVTTTSGLEAVLPDGTRMRPPWTC